MCAGNGGTGGGGFFESEEFDELEFEFEFELDELEEPDGAEVDGAGAVGIVAGDGLDDGGVADGVGLELDAGAEPGAELAGGVAAEALGTAAASEEAPDPPPPHDAHSKLAMTAIMIATARMGSILPILARWLWRGPRSRCAGPKQG